MYTNTGQSKLGKELKGIDRIVVDFVSDSTRRASTGRIVEEEPGRRVRSLTREIGAYIRIVHNILKAKHYHTFRYSVVQALVPADKLKRVQFCE